MRTARRWAVDVAHGAAVVVVVVVVAIGMDLLGVIDLSRRLMGTAVVCLAAFFASLDHARRRESRARGEDSSPS